MSAIDFKIRVDTTELDAALRKAHLLSWRMFLSRWTINTLAVLGVLWLIGVPR